MEEMNPYVFVAYSYQDKIFVEKLIADLQERGVAVWYDVNLLSPGDSIREVLMERLRQARAALFVITQSSASSPNVMNELGIALERAHSSTDRQTILLVCGSNVKLPYTVADTRHIYMSEPNADNLDYAAALFEILQIVLPLMYKPPVSGSPVAAEQEVSELSDKKEKAPPVEKPSERPPHYWLLKMKPATWTPEHLQVGQEAFFNTYYYGQERPEYKLFLNVVKGDTVLGYIAGDEKYIGFRLSVTSPIGVSNPQGEAFRMRVSEEIRPRVLLENFRTVIPGIAAQLETETVPPHLFFQLTESEYNQILALNAQAYQNNYLPFYQAEGDHRETTDQLDFQHDINSFATIITLEKVHPPLAIGLFGNWGSGKSFFMEKLRARIDEITRSKDADYIEHVVHVPFNSWHYSDTNLWASLATQIFESMHDYAQKKAYGEDAIRAIYDNLSLIRNHLEETQQKLHENASKIEDVQKKKSKVEEEIDRKKTRLDLWKTRKLVQIVLSDPGIESEFQDIRVEFKTEGLIDKIEEVDQKINKFRSAWSKIRQSFILLRDNRSVAWRWVWGTALLMALITYLVLGPLKPFIKDVVNGAYTVLTVVIAWLIGVTHQLSPYFKKISRFYKRLKSLKATIDKEKNKARLKEDDEITRLDQEIKQLIDQQNALKITESEAEQRKKRLETEIREIGSGKLLAAFLASRHTDDAYSKQLGIISWIRRDFSRLNDLFKSQTAIQSGESKTELEVKIDRIVLYIDDLDRCDADTVVEVLKAIHLLLAFRLFVVVVGVDPRWLNNAISKKYRYLFGGTRQKGSPDPSIAKPDQINSYDYLEKIFQIPFAIRPINTKGREQLIRYIIGNELVDATTKPVPPVSGGGISSGTQDKRPEAPPATGSGSAEPKTEDTQTRVEDLKRTKERVKFTQGELDYLKKISVLFGRSPRTINRYINIYRIIKAHEGLKVTDNYSTQDFMPVMFTLGVIVGYPAYAGQYVAALQEAAGSESFEAFLTRNTLPQAMLNEVLSCCEELKGKSVESMRTNLELLSRFSFTGSAA